MTRSNSTTQPSGSRSSLSASPQSLFHRTGFSEAAPLLLVFCIQVFFATYTVLGLTHTGSEDSNTYRVYLAIVIVFSTLLSLRVVLTRGLRIRHFFVLQLPAWIVMISLLDDSLGRTEPHKWSTLSVWIVLCVPAFLVGVAASKSKQLKYASLILEPMMLLFTISSALYALENIATGIQSYGLGGATYQSAAYTSALAYGINLYHLLFGENHHRWRFSTTRTYFVLSVALLPVQALSSLFSGGRGGVVLVALYTVVLVLLASFYRAKAQMGRGLAVISLLGAGGYSILPSLMETEYAYAIVGRVFGYIGDEGLNWGATSGRNVLYKEALQAIRESPIVGYGIFNWHIGDNPHNFFLELLLNGGFLYLLGWLVLLTYILMAIVRRVRVQAEALVLFMIALYPMVTLMFSGSYWLSPVFWFLVGAGVAWRAPPLPRVRTLR